MSDDDPNALRDAEIKRLVELARLAFENAVDREMPVRMRENWHRQYTNTVLALNQLLKDAQVKEYERRLRILEEAEKER